MDIFGTDPRSGEPLTPIVIGDLEFRPDRYEDLQAVAGSIEATPAQRIHAASQIAVMVATGEQARGLSEERLRIIAIEQGEA